MASRTFNNGPIPLIVPGGDALVKGSIVARPIGTRPGVLVPTRQTYRIVAGIFAASIVAGCRYIFELYNGGTLVDEFEADVPEGAGAITWPQLYASANIPTELASLVMFRDDPLSNLSSEGSPEGHVPTSDGENGIVWQEPQGGLSEVAWDDVTGKPATFPPATHNHDASYYTKAQVDTAIGAEATTRSTGDGTNAAAIAAETTARTNADNAHKNAATLDHPDASVTTAKVADGAIVDAKIGDRTVNDTLVPSGSTGALATLLSWLTYMLRLIIDPTGTWRTVPAISLASTKLHVDAAAPHSGHALSGHNHDGAYSAIGHNHTGVYSAVGHNHDGAYSALGHNHTGVYSPVAHNHDGTYAPASHEHDERYAPEVVTLVDGATIEHDVTGIPFSHAIVTLAGNRTLDIVGAVDGSGGRILFRQDATGGRTIRFPEGSRVVSQGGGTGYLSTTANTYDLADWLFDGTTFYVSIVKALNEQAPLPGGGDFDPTEFGTVLEWFEADAIVGLGDGDPVGLWEDLGPNSYDATQASTSLKPTYRVAGPNALPSVHFVADDWLGMAEAAAPTGNFTVFVVVRFNTLTSGAAVWGRARITNGVHIRVEAGSIKQYVWNGTTTATATTTAAPGTGSAVLVTGRYDGTTVDAWLNGANHGSASQTGAVVNISADQSSISGYRGTTDSAATMEDADICCILVYSEALSTEDRQAIETHLTTKYGL